jgi:hypothetical protein
MSGSNQVEMSASKKIPSTPVRYREGKSVFGRLTARRAATIHTSFVDGMTSK